MIVLERLKKLNKIECALATLPEQNRCEEEIEQIRKELIALEIIKNRLELGVYLECATIPRLTTENIIIGERLSEEEYNLLEEILTND